MVYVVLPAPRLVLLSGVVVSFLSACGGSGGSGVFGPLGGQNNPSNPTNPTSPTDPVVPSNPSPTFESLAGLASDLLYKSETLPTTPEASMPTTGLATYKGAASYVARTSIPSSVPNGTARYIADNPQTVSDFTMIANFGKDAVNGSFGNFVDKDTGTWQGQINFANGTITGNTFTATTGGSVGPAGMQTPTTGQIIGIFGGDAAEFAGGAVTMDGGPSTPTSDMVGVFAAEQ